MDCTSAESHHFHKPPCFETHLKREKPFYSRCRLVSNDQRDIICHYKLDGGRAILHLISLQLPLIRQIKLLLHWLSVSYYQFTLKVIALFELEIAKLFNEQYLNGNCHDPVQWIWLEIASLLAAKQEISLRKIFFWSMSGLKDSCHQAHYTYTVYICTRSRRTSAPLGTDLPGESLATTETYNVSSFDMPRRPSEAASTARENKKERHVICIRLRYYASVENLIEEVYVTSAALPPWLYWFVTPHHIPTKAFERNAFGENFNLQSEIQTQLSAVKVLRFASTFELYDNEPIENVNLGLHEFSNYCAFAITNQKCISWKATCIVDPVNRCWFSEVIKVLAMSREQSVLIKCHNRIFLNIKKHCESFDYLLNTKYGKCNTSNCLHDRTQLSVVNHWPENSLKYRKVTSKS